MSGGDHERAETIQRGASRPCHDVATLTLQCSNLVMKVLCTSQYDEGIGVLENTTSHEQVLRVVSLTRPRRPQHRQDAAVDFCCGQNASSLTVRRAGARIRKWDSVRKFNRGGGRVVVDGSQAPSL